MTNLLALQSCTCLLPWQPISWPKCSLSVEIKMAAMWLCKWLYDWRTSLKFEAIFYQGSWRKTKSQNHALGPKSLSLLPLPSFLSFFLHISRMFLHTVLAISTTRLCPLKTLINFHYLGRHSQVNYSFIYKIAGVCLSVVSFVLYLGSLESKFSLKTNTRCSLLTFCF